jgi:hypothetical protein
MLVLERLFLAHPRAVGEGYVDHFAAAARIGAAMIGGGLACLVHAVVPALFVTTGSATIRGLHARLTVRRPREPGAVERAILYEI